MINGLIQSNMLSDRVERCCARRDQRLVAELICFSLFPSSFPLLLASDRNKGGGNAATVLKDLNSQPSPKGIPLLSPATHFRPGEQIRKRKFFDNKAFLAASCVICIPKRTVRIGSIRWLCGGADFNEKSTPTSKCCEEMQSLNASTQSYECSERKCMFKGRENLFKLSEMLSTVWLMHNAFMT